MIYFNLAFLIIATALAITMDNPIARFANTVAVVLNFAAVSSYLMKYTC